MPLISAIMKFRGSTNYIKLLFDAIKEKYYTKRSLTKLKVENLTEFKFMKSYPSFNALFHTTDFRHVRNLVFSKIGFGVLVDSTHGWWGFLIYNTNFATLITTYLRSENSVM